MLRVQLQKQPDRTEDPVFDVAVIDDNAGASRNRRRGVGQLNRRRRRGGYRGAYVIGVLRVVVGAAGEH